jgi:hypothetical protein
MSTELDKQASKIQRSFKRRQIRRQYDHSFRRLKNFVIFESGRPLFGMSDKSTITLPYNATGPTFQIKIEVTLLDGNNVDIQAQFFYEDGHNDGEENMLARLDYILNVLFKFHIIRSRSKYKQTLFASITDHEVVHNPKKDKWHNDGLIPKVPDYVCLDYRDDEDTISTLIGKQPIIPDRSTVDARNHYRQEGFQESIEFKFRTKVSKGTQIIVDNMRRVHSGPTYLAEKTGKNIFEEGDKLLDQLNGKTRKLIRVMIYMNKETVDTLDSWLSSPKLTTTITVDVSKYWDKFQKYYSSEDAFFADGNSVYGGVAKKKKTKRKNMIKPKRKNFYIS